MKVAVKVAVNIPEHYGSWEDEYRALERGAELIDLSDRGIIAVTGADRARWLHGMVTNDISGLSPGQSTYCFVLDAQGHILADAYVLVEADRILIDCEPLVTGKLLKWLDHYIIMDDVELADLCATHGMIAAQGKRLLIPKEQWPDVWKRLQEGGARPVGWKAIEALRIENGIPRYGVDMDETTLPQETGQLRAIHFNKGCYIGQEIVERIRSRGHVNRMLVRLESPEPFEPGAAIEAEGREIGRITSAAFSPVRKLAIALGYVRREFTEPGTRVVVSDVIREIRG